MKLRNVQTGREVEMPEAREDETFVSVVRGELVIREGAKGQFAESLEGKQLEESARQRVVYVDFWLLFWGLVLAGGAFWWLFTFLRKSLEDAIR
jgi:hypothetical protein